MSLQANILDDLPHVYGRSPVLRSVPMEPYSASGGYRDSYPDDYMHIHLWDVATGKHIKKFTQRTGKVTSLAFSPDGTILASGGYDSTNLWDVATGEHIRVLKGPKDWRWTGDLAFSPDGTTLAGGYTRDIDRIGRGVPHW